MQPRTWPLPAAKPYTSLIDATAKTYSNKGKLDAEQTGVRGASTILSHEQRTCGTMAGLARATRRRNLQRSQCSHPLECHREHLLESTDPRQGALLTRRLGRAHLRNDLP